MEFVDGENLTLRAQELGDLPLTEGKYYRKDGFIWLPYATASYRFSGGLADIRDRPVRSTYYTSVSGDDQLLRAVREHLWNLGFNPGVFKKHRTAQKAKGVDIALTKDMLSHAFQGNYDVAVLIAGDGDYVPLVEEVKRLGKRVFVWFFAENGLNSELRLAADEFFDITRPFTENWRNFPRK